jgi:hypothetical protein
VAVTVGEATQAACSVPCVIQVIDVLAVIWRVSLEPAGAPRSGDPE